MHPFKQIPCGLFLGLFSLALGNAGCNRVQPRVVVYCAQDEEFAKAVFEDFQKQAGLPIAPHYDNEANKTIALYQELLREADRPRCDVFWNNEILTTILLQRKGLLQPYASPLAEPYPAWTKAKDDTWHAFADRARVLLVNTDQVKEADRPSSLLDLTQPRWKGLAALAKPHAGSSATQAACLFEVLGKDKAREYYLALRENKINIVPGNKQAAEGVGAGQFAVAVTDTDDAIDEVRKGRPVVIIFPDRDRPKNDRMGTLFIPNTLAILRNDPNPEGSRKLVDFLLGPEVEKRLAESESAQMPLNPQVKAHLPPQIEAGRTAKRMDVNFEKAADLWEEVQAFVSKEFLRP